MSDRSDWIAHGSLAGAGVALVVALFAGFADDRDDSTGAAPVFTAPPGTVADLDDGAVADPGADPAEIVADAAEAMGSVTSVEFDLSRTGAPIYVDAFESIALDSAIGQFVVPSRAQATLDVTVDGDLRTRIGAVAVDAEVWMSNPVTGRFETLPAGYDLDPSRFFDPSGGWRPLLANLEDPELVAVDDRGGERWHVRGTATAADVENITVGLVTDQDVLVDLWVHPGTSLVTAIEFDTELADGPAHWTLELTRYGDQFTITPPEDL